MNSFVTPGLKGLADVPGIAGDSPATSSQLYDFKHGRELGSGRETDERWFEH